MNEILHVGLDVGSTTVKIIVMDKNKKTIYKLWIKFCNKPGNLRKDLYIVFYLTLNHYFIKKKYAKTAIPNIIL